MLLEFPPADYVRRTVRYAKALNINCVRFMTPDFRKAIFSLPGEQLGDINICKLAVSILSNTCQALP